MFPHAPAVVLAIASTALLSACGGGSSAAGSGEELAVVTSFYPLQFVTERVGGERVDVTSLTKPGAEPHDLELTPQDVARVSDADLVVYLHGFQPAVDDAVDGEAGDRALNVEDSARLDLGPVAEETEHEDEHQDDGHGHDESVDPHFWLDPTRLADVADAVTQRLTELDPEHADDFQQAADDLREELTALDAEFQEGLADCRSRDLVTSHAAFGYLAERYDLQQVGITGLTPDADPNPRDLADVAEFVREHGVTTVYTETLVDPAVAETIASETGARTAVLDPIEGLTDESAGSDYLEVMRANLSTLRQGQGCT